MLAVFAGVQAGVDVRTHHGTGDDASARNNRCLQVKGAEFPIVQLADDFERTVRQRLPTSATSWTQAYNAIKRGVHLPALMQGCGRVAVERVARKCSRDAARARPLAWAHHCVTDHMACL